MTLAAEAAGFGVWIWSIARNQIWGSERWLGLFGFAPEVTVTFENLIQRIHPDDREGVERAVRRAVADRSDYAAEYRVVLPDNTQRWVAARGRVYPDSHGKPVRMMGATIDISERKRSEEANRNAHELMAAVFNSVPGLLYLYTEDGQIVQWNKKHEELTGFTAEELLNRRARDWYDEEDLSTFDRAIRRIFSEGYADAEMKLIHKNGERVPYFLTGTKVMINGKPHLVGIAIDISVRKKAEELLRESEERMTLAAEAAEFGVWMWNIVRNQVWGSERWLRLFGFVPGAALSFEKVIERIHPDDRESVEREVRRALEDRLGYRGEYRVLLPDNTQRWVAARGRVYPDSHGKPVRMMGATIDITARKQAELELQQQRGELAHLSRVTMLGELSGSLAHELNQPLTAILSNAQAAQRFLAHDNADLNEVRDILKDIVDEDKRAGEVIRRLRLLLKKGEVQHQPFNLNEVVREVLKLVRSDLVNQGVAVHTELAPALPEVNADRVQLQQVLLNLVMNACDAMAGGPAGGHKLIIRTELAGDEGIRVSVADRGVGLAPDNLEKVFEPFFTTKVQGMGLGLSVCRTIITAHGGRLWGVNNPERGATFHFTLPASTEANP